MSAFRLNVEYSEMDIYIYIYVYEKDGVLFAVYSSRGPRRRTAGSRVLQSIENPVIILRPEPWKGGRSIKATMNNHRECSKVKQLTALDLTAKWRI